MKLFAATVEYAPSLRIDGERLIYVRLKVICEANGSSLWEEDFEDVETTLAENDIYTSSVKIMGNDCIARIDTSKTDMSAFVEWTPTVKTDSLCIRTFYTILNKDKLDMFGKDSAWLTIFMGDRSLAEWFKLLEAKV